MRRSMLREILLTAFLALMVSVSLSYGAVLAIDHLLGQPEEPEVISGDIALVDAD